MTGLQFQSSLGQLQINANIFDLVHDVEAVHDLY